MEYGPPSSSLVHALSEFHVGPWPVVAMVNRRLERAEAVGIQDCKQIDKCEMCTFSEQKSILACKETGRKEKMECTFFDGDGKRHHCSGLLTKYELFLTFALDSRTITNYRSCKHTDADNQFAMVS